MEWDQAKIDAAVSTLTEALGAICDVAVNVEHAPVREVEPFYDDHGIPWRQYARDPLGETKVTITITPREE